MQHRFGNKHEQGCLPMGWSWVWCPASLRLGWLVFLVCLHYLWSLVIIILNHFCLYLHQSVRLLHTVNAEDFIKKPFRWAVNPLHISNTVIFSGYTMDIDILNYIHQRQHLRCCLAVFKQMKNNVDCAIFFFSLPSELTHLRPLLMTSWMTT